MKLWFGEHIGKELSEVSDDYLTFLAEKTSAPTVPNRISEANKKRIRDQWKDLLSEVEDELSEREEGEQPNFA